jgi:HNH endonuclease domain protein|nr:MAG TPA: HNH endonuclease [Caudoviricetes sp.]
MAKDNDYIRLIHTPRWLRLRRDILTAHPICERCEAEGYVTPATEVHHRKPVEHGVNYNEKYRLMYDPNNLCSLCHDCHVRVHTEMGRSGKEATRRRNAEHVEKIIADFFHDG